MEIDFLGLNSSKHSTEQEGFANSFPDTEGGVETSLSLSTSSFLDSHREIHNFPENKTWEFPAACDKMNIPSCSGSLAPYNHQNSSKIEKPGMLLVPTTVFNRPAAAGFLYDLKDATSSNLRKMSELPSEPSTSLTMLYPGSPTAFKEPPKAETAMHSAGNASTSISRSGHTPTVAMARRATLARFLEKRSHRMNQGRTSHLVGKPANAIPKAARQLLPDLPNTDYFGVYSTGLQQVSTHHRELPK